jgi:hypothetical protein
MPPAAELRVRLRRRRDLPLALGQPPFPSPPICGLRPPRLLAPLLVEGCDRRRILLPPTGQALPPRRDRCQLVLQGILTALILLPLCLLRLFSRCFLPRHRVNFARGVHESSLRDGIWLADGSFP